MLPIRSAGVMIRFDRRERVLAHLAALLSAGGWPTFSPPRLWLPHPSRFSIRRLFLPRGYKIQITSYHIVAVLALKPRPHFRTKITRTCPAARKVQRLEGSQSPSCGVWHLPSAVRRSRLLIMTTPWHPHGK